MKEGMLMKRKKSSIRRKITSLLLAMTFTALCLTGGASVYGMYSMRNISDESSRQLGYTAAEDAEAALEKAAGERLLELAEGKALYIEEKFHSIIACVNGIAQEAEEIYRNPEKYPDREVPLPEKNSHELAAQLLWSDSLMSRTEGDAGGELLFMPDKERQEEILKLGNIQDLLVQYNRNNDMISSVYLATESGWLILADYIPGHKYTGGGELPDCFEARNRQWYKLACRAGTGETVYSDVMVDFHEGKDCIVCAQAVYVDGRIVAVAGIGSYLDTVQETVWNAAVGESGYSFLVNRAGRVIVSGAQEGETAVQEGSNIDIRQSENQELAAAAEKMLRGERGLTELMLEGRNVYLAYAPLVETGWSLATVMDVEEALAPAVRSRQTILHLAEEVFLQQDATIHGMIGFYFVIVMLTAIAVGAAGIIFAKKLTFPIRRLTGEAVRIGRGKLDEQIHIESGDEVEELGNAFNSMTSRLKKYIESLSAATAEQERIRTELDLASQIQADMLPDAEVFADKQGFVIDACMMPAKEVGGDFYDFFLIDNDRLAFLIADVSGKGVPASLFMVVAKTLLQSRLMEGGALEAAVADVNERLCAGNENGMFVTAWIGVLTLSTGKLQYVNAGHNPPLLGNPKTGFSYITETGGFVLAGMEDMTYAGRELKLEPDDVLFLYTDGVTETNDENGNLYGEARLKTLLNEWKEAEPKKLPAAVMQDIQRFQGNAVQFDDVTMLVLSYRKTERTAEEEAPAVIAVPARMEYREEVQDFLENRLQDKLVAQEDISRVLTAFDELFSNICHYGKASEIKAACSVSGNEIIVSFEDDGIPFHPWEKEDPDIELTLEEKKEGGLGIYIIRKLMDEVSYRYEDGKNKNRLIRKKIKTGQAVHQRAKL